MKKKYNELFEFSKGVGLDCFASIFNKSDYNILKKTSNKFIKIPSTEAYDINLIKSSIDDFESVFVSTGAMKFHELKNLNQFKNEKNFIPLHCVSMYPLDEKNANFDKFLYLKSNFKNVGYSGHCRGINDAIYALSLGAYCVEKHFTSSNNLDGRDNKFAIIPDQLKDLCEYNKILKKLNINHGLDLQMGEVDAYENYRGRWRN